MDRPWGTWEILASNHGWQFKRLIVRPKQRLSLQYHQHRREIWVCLKGKGKATVGQKEKVMKPGVLINVPIGVLHRVENTLHDDPLEFLEIQLGEILSEDDISRIEDDYGRIPT